MTPGKPRMDEDVVLEVRKRLTEIERQLVTDECYTIGILRKNIDKMYFDRGDTSLRRIADALEARSLPFAQ